MNGWLDGGSDRWIKFWMMDGWNDELWNNWSNYLGNLGKKLEYLIGYVGERMAGWMEIEIMGGWIDTWIKTGVMHRKKLEWEINGWKLWWSDEVMDESMAGLMK